VGEVSERTVGRIASVRDYTEGSILASIWRLALPMTLEMFLGNVFQIVELYLVGGLGAAALAAISLSGSVRWVLSSLGMGLGIGAAAVVARRVGERDARGADHATGQAISLAVVIGCLVGLVGWAISLPVVELLGAGDEVIADASAYLRITFLGYPLSALAFAMSSILRGAGNATEALWMAMAMNGTNVLLLPFLVRGIGVLPPLGVSGAALSFVLSQGISFVLGLIVVTGGRARVRLHLRDLAPDWRVMGRMVSIGFPSSIQSVLRSSSRVAMVAIVAPFGTAALAGYGIATRLTVMLLTPGFGMGNAAGTLVGQCLGAKKPARAERSVWTIAGVNLVYMVLAIATLGIFAPHAAGLFNQDEAVVAVAAEAIRVVAVGYCFSAVGVVMGRGLDGAGNTVPAMVINLFTLWGLQVPFAFLLSRYTALGLRGVWLGWGLANMSNGLMMAYWFKRGGWKLKRV